MRSWKVFEYQTSRGTGLELFFLFYLFWWLLSYLAFIWYVCFTSLIFFCRFNCNIKWGIFIFIFILFHLPSLRISLYEVILWNSSPEVFCKENVLKNFTKFTGKHLCQSLVLIKKSLFSRVSVFPVNFGNFSRTSFFTGHLQLQLLLLNLVFSI